MQTNSNNYYIFILKNDQIIVKLSAVIIVVEFWNIFNSQLITDLITTLPIAV